MSGDDILQKLPPRGFLKVARENPAKLSPEDRAALIRRGNEFFNRGQTELARRVFLTTRYSDGLIRVGDRYVEAGKPVEAMAAYMSAPCPQKAEALAARMAGVLSHWLREGRGSEST